MEQARRKLRQDSEEEAIAVRHFVLEGLYQ